MRFATITVDPSFRSEGIAVADVNRDGAPDLLVGDLWYEAPGWTPRTIAPVRELDPSTEYSGAFIVFADDVNRDGWVDELVFGPPGAAASWRENPGDTGGAWRERPMAATAASESPAFASLGGPRVLVFQPAGAQMAWFEPGPHPALPFVEHRIDDPASGAGPVPAHSLGVGDVDGDGLRDVVISKGWWRAPDWRWNAAELGPDCAQMHVLDVNGDGRNDVVSSSAHAVGVWWYEQGRRGTSHWFELRREGRTVTWRRHTLDVDSGVGTQFEVTDVNRDGRLDVAVSNKTGVHLFLQLP